MPKKGEYIKFKNLNGDVKVRDHYHITGKYRHMKIVITTLN